MDLEDFIAGLRALTIENVTMLGSKPSQTPSDGVLPVAWVDIPTIIGAPPTTMFNNTIRPMRYRALILIAVAYDRMDEQVDREDALMAVGKALKTSLDASSFGFRLEYEIAINRKVNIGSDSFYGVAAVITGER
jgi:hypothetical protein